MVYFLQQNWQMIVVGLMLVLVLWSFLKEIVAPELVAMAAMVILMLLGILKTKEALLVFSHGGPVIIACMFILSGALDKVGLIEAMGHWFERIAGKSETRIMIVLMLSVAAVSAFINNTPVVVVFMPIVLAVCRRQGKKASRYLIPLSYAAIAGGTCTIVGTSTNIVAANMAQERGMEVLTFFEIAPMGLIVLATVMLYILTIGRKLLPDRPSLAALVPEISGREFITETIIPQNSPLVGKKIEETFMWRNRDLRVLDVIRGGQRITDPLRSVALLVGDEVVLKTHASGVAEIHSDQGLNMVGVGAEQGLQEVKTESAMLVEAIIGPNSPLLGRSLRSLEIGRRLNLRILALHRQGVNLGKGLLDVLLAVGDTLLIEGPTNTLTKFAEDGRFINLSTPVVHSVRRSKAPFVLGAFALFIVCGSLGFGDLELLAMAAALIVMLTRCIKPQEAFRSIEWGVLFLIYGMTALGLGMEKSGLIGVIADAFVNMQDTITPIIMVGMVYFFSSLLTEIISNNATAALLTPLVCGVALRMGLDPKPFVIAVMFGSSASFATPIGYQTNTMVYGAGGYKFVDFVRVGLPLNLILCLIASFFIPILWPF